METVPIYIIKKKQKWILVAAASPPVHFEYSDTQLFNRLNNKMNQVIFDYPFPQTLRK
ncbi:MAG: hypothetical protein LBB47_02945 [Spirochaetaceae bacterium]|nr:hypothetical protein [Spirochaetaceae bacterium]